jgi:crossover junction endodeoxyribonuclease RuvC
MRILGIDPGLRTTGYACIQAANPIAPSIIEAGVFRLVNPGAKLPTIAARLEELDNDFRALLARTSPQAVAIEGLFSHYQHPATAIIMGHARGVLMLAVQQAKLRLIELKPAQVKKSATGFGQADKGQMQRAIQSHFGLADLPKPPDLADALAIALCAAHHFALAPSSSREAATVSSMGRKPHVATPRIPHAAEQPA